MPSGKLVGGRAVKAISLLTNSPEMSHDKLWVGGVTVKPLGVRITN